MHLNQSAQSLYTAFDVYPSSKGAATHIFHFASTLFETYAPGLLYVLASPKMSEYQLEDSVEIIRFNKEIPNFLQRAQAFGVYLSKVLSNQHSLKIAHFRDPWGGLPILMQQAQKQYQTIYEVNGLPSIELPYRYPQLLPHTLKKIQAIEDFCLEKAHHILCPSQTIRTHLIERSIASHKIHVIPNGANIPSQIHRPLEAPAKYLIYFGALQSWQGLDTLWKAFSYLEDYADLYLVICASQREKFSKHYIKLAEKWGISDRIIWKFQLNKKELYNWVSHAYLSLAPLKACSRNLDQGCCPLKILESMALGTPVLASDIPAVREIIKDENLGKLIRPDRPAEWARGIRLMLEYPDKLKALGSNAQKHIAQHFTWSEQKMRLKKFYEDLPI